MAQERRMVIFDGKGRATDWSPDVALGGAIAFDPSPNGLRIAWMAPNTSSIDEIWIAERGGSASRRLVAVPGADCDFPVWSPDGRRIVYSQIGNTDQDGVYVVSVDGGSSPVRVARCTRQDPIAATSWSPDGSQILGTREKGADVEVVAIAASPPIGALPEPVALFEHANMAAFSPSGRAIAYVSWSAGRYGYVCISPWSEGRALGEGTAVAAGIDPIWSRDGRTIYHKVNFGTKVLGSAITMLPRPSAAPPFEAWDLAPLRVARILYDVLPDGHLLAIQKSPGEDEITRFDITLNFFEDLKSKMRPHGESR